MLAFSVDWFWVVGTGFDWFWLVVHFITSNSKHCELHHVFSKDNILLRISIHLFCFSNGTHWFILCNTETKIYSYINSLFPNQTFSNNWIIFSFKTFLDCKVFNIIKLLICRREKWNIFYTYNFQMFIKSNKCLVRVILKSPFIIKSYQTASQFFSHTINILKPTNYIKICEFLGKNPVFPVSSATFPNYGKTVVILF